MPNFQYTAITISGERVAGVLAGGNEQAVLSELEARRLTPVAVAPAKESSTRGRRVSGRDLAQSYVQLSDLLRAGVPLMRSLTLLGSRKSAPALAKVFNGIAEAVSEGTEMAAAMEANPDVFPRVHVAMVRAGEKGGFLEAVLARLGQFLTAQEEMRSKVIGSMIYPAVLMIAGVLILGVIFGYFLPMFRPMFAKIQLSPITKLVFGISDFVSGYWYIMGAIVVLLVFGVLQLRKQPAVQLKLDRFKVRGPIVGPIFRSFGAARFCRILGTLLSNSIPMLTAMQIARDAAGNSLIEAAIDDAAEAVRHGQALAPPLAASGLFMDDIIEMIAVGESANNLDEVLVAIADTLEKRMDRQLSAATTLIEPLMMMVLALIVAMVAIAVILPITQLSSGVS